MCDMHASVMSALYTPLELQAVLVLVLEVGVGVVSCFNI